jgi:septal ring factor EnvC (AmiA/AmiB activator)
MMSELQAEALAQLLAVLGEQAKSNGELATEIRQQGDRIEAATTEIRNLASSVDENSRQTVRLCAAHEVEGKAQEQRRTLLVRGASAMWGVAKSPMGMLLAAFVGWLAATHLAVPAEIPQEPAEAVFDDEDASFREDTQEPS